MGKKGEGIKKYIQNNKDATYSLLSPPGTEMGSADSGAWRRGRPEREMDALKEVEASLS